MPIVLTVAEKREVVQRRCKQAMTAQLEQQITLDSILALNPGGRTEGDDAAIEKLRLLISQLDGQVAYFQAQWEALEDVVVDEELETIIPAASAPVKATNGNGNRATRRAAKSS